MSDFGFYDENPGALQKVNIVTRDNLGALAVAILSAKNDLSSIDESNYNKLVEDLHDIIRGLHRSYSSLNLSDV